MNNIFSCLPGFYKGNFKFMSSLFLTYLQNLNNQQSKFYRLGVSQYFKKYKSILHKYMFLLRSFYKHYYSIKKSKTVPSHYGLYLVYKYLYITAQLDTGFLNRRRDTLAHTLKLVHISRFINRKSSGSVRKKKNLFKLHTLFDRLFF